MSRRRSYSVRGVERGGCWNRRLAPPVPARVGEISLFSRLEGVNRPRKSAHMDRPRQQPSGLQDPCQHRNCAVQFRGDPGAVGLARLVLHNQRPAV
jgi:hypothetical protein